MTIADAEHELNEARQALSVHDNRADQSRREGWKMPADECEWMALARVRVNLAERDLQRVRSDVALAAVKRRPVMVHGKSKGRKARR